MIETEKEALKTLIENIIKNCVETTIIGHYPYLKHKCSNAFIKEYIEERRKSEKNE